MYQDLFDDGLFCDSNVVPWGPPSAISPPLMTSLVGTLEVGVSNPTDLAKPGALRVEGISYGGSPVDETEPVIDTASGHSASRQEQKQGFPFLALPFEIRLHVYKWIHLAHPVKQLQLTPWLPTPIYDTYFVKLVCPDRETQYQAHSEPTAQSPGTVVHVGADAQTPRLSPYRPLAGMPTSLLRANEQIYRETRALPFMENEFVFINWFASGLWAARAFLKNMEPWQCDAMRYARLELLARDVSDVYASEWKELCGLWSNGLRGLRLKVVSGGGVVGSGAAEDSAQKGQPGVGIAASSGGVQAWVESGLGSLKQLRHLEVELLIAEWDDEKKVGWCKCLQQTLNEAKAKNTWVSVICVERDLAGTG